MSLKHTWSKAVKSDAGSAASQTDTYTAVAEVNGDTDAAHATTREVDVNVDVSQIVSFFIYSDKDVTLKSNSTGAPAQTIALDAKKMLDWRSDDVAANPLTVDITKLFFVNAGSTAADDAKIKFGFLLDVDS
jgi:hypothetical protein